MYNLFLIDDEPWALTGLEQILPWQDYGFSICGRYTSSEKALLEMGDKHPDAVFTDIRMPRLSGIELISRARAEHGSHMEFVIVSAYSDFEVARRALEYGAVGYVLKLLDADEVREVVLRLKDRLDQKQGPQSLRLNLGAAEELEQAAAQLQRILPAGQTCFVGVLEEPALLPAGWNGVPLELSERPACFCWSPAQDPPELPCACGWSIPRRDASALGDMAREALAAFRGGFAYSSHPAVAEIQSYLGQNYGQQLSLSKLASHFYLSENYLCDLFKKNTGETILNFLKALRLENACRLLRETSLSIKEIAGAVGFSDYSYFGRTFRRSIGQTPDHYRSGWTGEKDK